MVFFVPWEVLGGKLFRIVSVDKAVADPDLKIRGLGGRGEGRSSRPWDKGEARSQKNFFSAFRASVWSKIKGVAPPPPDPPLQSYPLSNTERAPCKVILDSEFHGMDSRFQVLGFVFFVSGTWISVSKAENLDRASTKIPVLFPECGIQIPLYWRTEPES